MPPETLEQCLEIAHARLYPSVFNPNYLVLRRRREIFAEWLDTIPGKDWQVLDVGGRYQPYRPLVEERAASYVAIDMQPTPLVSVVGSGESLPFANECFDLVIATQVFEYFQMPHLAAAEVYRVMKPGGCLLMSAASFAPGFAREEHWRYLPAGLRTLLAPFSSVEIVPEVRMNGTFFRTINLHLGILGKTRWLRYAMDHSAIALSNLMGWQLERLVRFNSDQFAANYCVLATK